MADFLVAHRKTMGDEGGYANNPADAGGETYKGIARKFWPQWFGWRLVDGIKAKTTTQPHYGTTEYKNWVAYLNTLLAQLTQLQQLVVSFYQKNFWDKNRLSEINNQDVADWLYNHIVNAGGQGIKWMQAAAGVTPDGGIGDKTIAAINAQDPAGLLDMAMNHAVAYRLAKVKADPSQRQFLHSWLERDGVSEAKITQVMLTA